MTDPQTSALAKAAKAPIIEITEEVRRLVQEQIAPDLTAAELEVFLEVCKARGLNPLNPGQIYAIKRYDSASQSKRMTIQTGVDGIRLMAERTGLYQGQTPTEWCGKDLEWMEVWTGDQNPFAARVGILRAGWNAPMVAVARYTSYVQKYKNKSNKWVETATWHSMPDVMLAKCAETLAFRKAFPGMFDAIAPDVEPTWQEQESRVVIDEETGEVLDDEPVAANCSACGAPCSGGEGALCPACEKEIPAPEDRPRLPAVIPVLSFGDNAGMNLDDPDLGIEFLEWFVKNETHPMQSHRETARAVLEQRLGGAQ